MLHEGLRRILPTASAMLLGSLLFLAGWLPAGAWADDWPLTAAIEIEQRLQPQVMDGFAIRREQGTDLCGALARFYRYRNYAPAWVDRYGLLPEAALALAVLKQADNQGLRYADYYNPWVDDVLGGMITRPVILGDSFDGKQVPLDLALTDMVLRYVYDRTKGRIDPHTIADRKGAAAPPLSRDLARELAEMLERGRLAAFFERLGPQQTAYQALRNSLPRFRKIAAAGGWATIDAGPKLQQGECGRRVVQLRDRLSVSGDARPSSESMAPCFDDRLAEAVARFQHRHGLHPDGVVGPQTLAVLNVAVETRIRQIQVNLERWRWMPEDLGARYVLANIPGFQLQMVDDGQVIRTLRTIVGKQDRPTPVLTSMITYLEINPYWHVPPTIAGKDLLPKIQADPSFLIRQHFRVFDGWGADAHEVSPYAVDWAALSERYFPYRLRQEPAAGNALGRVKIMFPNDESVYIHDTPARSLFNRTTRSFSSGCVRVEEPLTLAGLLLSRQGWDQERLAQAVAAHDRQVVTLDNPVPVYLVYWTAWADPNGDINFRDDIYRRDQTLLEAMTASPALHTTCRNLGPHPTYLGDYHAGGWGGSY
jgi:L,D-transpeptidase YcbB